MSEAGFYTPQRQSVIGILLIFSTALFHLVRNFWVLGVYFFVGDINKEIMLWSLLGLVLVLILTLVYSFMSYLRFRFYIDREKGEFILEKGVFSSEVVSIPFNKIQEVNFKRNLLQRLLGVYSVAIDTAGSKDKEVEIKALTRAQADQLGESLMQFAARESVEENDETKEVPVGGDQSTRVLWEYKLRFISLLKLGFTSNYLRGLAVLVTFYFSLREQFQSSEEFMEMPDVFLVEMFSTGVLILGLVLVGMLITVGETFIKYYNLSLKRFPEGLQVEMGLRENIKKTIRAERVQLLQVLTNPLQRKMDMYKLKISLASSQNDLKNERIQIPGLPREILGKLMAYFQTPDLTEKLELRPSILLLFRKISRGLIPLLLIIPLVFFDVISLGLGWIWTIAGLYVALMIGFQFLYFKSLRLASSKDFLIKYSGVWIKKKQIIQMYKLQAVSLNQPIWYKKRGLVNLVFHTAGGDVSFHFFKKAEAVSLMNHLLFKIESNNKNWM